MTFEDVAKHPRERDNDHPLLRFIRDHQTLERFDSPNVLQATIQKLGGKITTPREHPECTSTGWAGKTGGFFMLGKSIVEANIGQDQYVNMKVWVRDVDAQPTDASVFLHMFSHLRHLLIDGEGAGYDVGPECMKWIGRSLPKE